ncbi:MAG: hypothetical protein COA47_12315 [Robiginitomaculum sp.]|nr:MAG: hypothetical protein COA47_12315 [Robiginitomaculum sp.]
MILSLAILLVAVSSPVGRLTDACMAEGEARANCVCYADFIKDHTSDRELGALATLATPQNHENLENAFRALMKAGLTPAEIFDIGLRADKLTDTATKACAGK